MTSRWRRTRRQRSKTCIKCWRYGHTEVGTLCFLFHRLAVTCSQLLTDVDRVWTRPVAAGSSPQRHWEGMGQIDSCHAGEGKESEAWGGKVWEATAHVNALTGWLHVIESGLEVYYQQTVSADFQFFSWYEEKSTSTGALSFVFSMTSTFHLA